MFRCVNIFVEFFVNVFPGYEAPSLVIFLVGSTGTYMGQVNARPLDKAKQLKAGEYALTQMRFLGGWGNFCK